MSTSAAAAAAERSADHPTPIVTLRRRGRQITSSYEEEKDAMLMAVERIVQNSPQGNWVRQWSVLTVSRSLLNATSHAWWHGQDQKNTHGHGGILQSGDAVDSGSCGYSWQRGSRRGSQGGCNASSTDMPPQPVSLSSALRCMDRIILDPPIEHERTAAVYEKINLLPRSEWGGVSERCCFAGSSSEWSLQQVQSVGYQHLIDPTVDPVCPRCGEKPHTVEHWLTEWPGTEATRQEIFGSVSVPFSILTEQPGKAVLMSRRTL